MPPHTSQSYRSNLARSETKAYCDSVLPVGPEPFLSASPEGTSNLFETEQLRTMNKIEMISRQPFPRKRRGKLVFTAALALMAAAVAVAQTPLAPAKMKAIAHVDQRYQAFNVEMVEVTGGRFWAPYKAATTGPTAVPDTKPASAMPGGLDASRFRYRAPIDLANPQLRKLAAALGPTYIRISGTWANSTYFDDSNTLAKPPEGFGGVLTAKEWKGVLDFSKAVDAKIVTSFAIGQGVRDANGVWTPVQAQKLIDFTKANGGQIALAEYFNEPTFAAMGGAVKGYNAEAYGRDFNIFAAFIRKNSPGTKIVGPDSVGEGGALTRSMTPKPGQPAPQGLARPAMIKTEDMLAAEGPGLDGFAYHFYGGVSQRCRPKNDIDADPGHALLAADWLTRTESEEAYYQKLRDRFEPGKPMWLTETAEAACGGDPWASTFVDGFRYLHQLGVLAKIGVQSVMHNTLAASDYGLIDETSLAPRPNYWSAVLWRRLMGATVLEAAAASAPNQYVYAHCLNGHPGGVAVLALNTDHDAAQKLNLNAASQRYSLTADDLMGSTAKLNGTELKLTASGDLPAIEGAKTPAGEVTLPPASINFFAIPGANNPACR